MAMTLTRACMRTLIPSSHLHTISAGKKPPEVDSPEHVLTLACQTSPGGGPRKCELVLGSPARAIKNAVDTARYYRTPQGVSHFPCAVFATNHDGEISGCICANKVVRCFKKSHWEVVPSGQDHANVLHVNPTTREAIFRNLSPKDAFALKDKDLLKRSD